MALNFPARPAEPDLNSPSTYNQRVLAGFNWCFNVMPNYMAGLTAGDFFPVQSGPNDAAADKIMKTKAFGHGLVASENPELTVDMDDAAMPTGATIYAGASTLNRPDGRNGAGMAWRGWGGLGTAGELHQLFGVRRTSGGPTDLYYRSLDVDDNWGDWVKLLHSGNIVGDVSENGRAAIDDGSNANGEYLRLAGGTLICTNGGSAITTPAAIFVGPITKIDGDKMWFGRWKA